MTTANRQRCAHCHSPYIYHPSTYGGEVQPYNHHEFCSSCYKAVLEALKSVPVKYEKKFVPTDKYTKEQIVQHQEGRCMTGFPIRRIFPSCIDMSGKTQHMIVCELMPDREWYKAEWWTHDPEKVDITKEAWCSLET
jgi:hypothetical protein